MTDVEPVVTDFAATGRTGRRNALPDILGSTAGAGMADLPDKLAQMAVSADDGEQGGEASATETSGSSDDKEKTEGT